MIDFERHQMIDCRLAGESCLYSDHDQIVPKGQVTGMTTGA